MKININIPYIMYFDDYSEIRDFMDKFNELTGGKPKLKYTEIMGENDFGYKALFYFKKQDKAYKQILSAYKLSQKEDKE